MKFLIITIMLLSARALHSQSADTNPLPYSGFDLKPFHNRYNKMNTTLKAKQTLFKYATAVYKDYKTKEKLEPFIEQAIVNIRNGKNRNSYIIINELVKKDPSGNEITRIDEIKILAGENFLDAIENEYSSPSIRRDTSGWSQRPSIITFETDPNNPKQIIQKTIPTQAVINTIKKVKQQDILTKSRAKNKLRQINNKRQIDKINKKLEEEFKKIKQELVEIDKERQKTLDEIDKLEKEINKTEKQIVKTAREIKNLEKEINTTEKEINQIENELESLNDRVNLTFGTNNSSNIRSNYMHKEYKYEYEPSYSVEQMIDRHTEKQPKAKVILDEDFKVEYVPKK